MNGPSESNSIWKKEIHLRKKPEGESEPEPVREFVIPEPQQHWWDKEISLSRGGRSEPEAEPLRVPEQPVAELVPEPKDEPAPQPVAELVPEPKAELPSKPTAEFTPEAKAELPPSPEPEAEAKPGRAGRALGRKKRQASTAPKPAPPPSQRRARAERVVGLKIGGSQIAAACIANGGRVRLEKAARTPLESGIVAGGELRDPQTLAAALRAFFAEHRLPRRGVRLGIASSRIGVRGFEIAGIDDESQFVNAVRFRAQEALPIPLDEAVLDYRVLSESVGENGERTRRVLLVVAHRELVDRYVEACQLAGLTLAGIDLEAFALLRALAPPADREGSALVAVSIGHERTTLAVSDGHVCEFTRVLEWGGWALNVALAGALDSTPAEVESVKRNLSLVDGPVPDGLTPEQAGAAVDALRRGVESLARELVSSLTYYQSQVGSLGIGEVVVTGGTARLAGLAQELERLLGVPVRVGNPLSRLEVAQPVGETDLASLAVAIGLGIED